MLIFLSIVICIVRYFTCPLGEIPDLPATIPGYLPYNIQNQIYNLGINLPELRERNILENFLTGSSYLSRFELPSFSVYLLCCLPFLLCSCCLQFIFLSSNFLQHENFHKYYRRLAYLVILLPSVSFALISPKVEAIINSLALVTIFAFIPALLPTGVSFRLHYSIPKIILLVIVIQSLTFVIYFLSPDNQFYIVYTFFLFILIFLTIKHVRLLPRNLLSLSFNRKNLRPLFSYCFLIVVFFLVAFAPSYLPGIYALLVRIAPSNITQVASLYIADDGLLFKYSPLSRPVFTFFSFIFAGATGYSVQIFTRVLGIFFITRSYFLYFKARAYTCYQSPIVAALLFILLSVTIFPGYSNIKYWIFLSPLLLLPGSIYSFYAVLVVSIAIYAELLFKSLWLFI